MIGRSSAPSSLDHRTKVNRVIWRIFTKKYGITLQQPAVDFLIDKVASSVTDGDLEAVEELIEYVAGTYSRQDDRQELVGLAALQATVDGIVRAAANREDFGAVDVRDYVTVVSAFDITNWDYDPHTKQFTQLQNESKSILCQAHDKIRMFVRRYEITKQRLLRTERFTGPQSGSLVDGAESVRSKLSAIKSVKGQAFAEAKVLFGMLTEMVEGQWFLEDPEEFIKLDFSRVKSVMDGYYCEGAMVLVEGYSTEESFEVHTIEMVPAEQASITRSLQSHPDPLSDCRKEIESRETLCRIMDQQSYSNMLFFSEMHLDNAALMQCFGEILEGCSSDPPAVIVLMGRFLSVVPADGPKAFDAYETAFARLGNLIASHKNIRESSRFVLVPSQSDAFYPNILPRPALPADLFEGLREQGIDFIPASNPCHIKCFTRDIAVLRLDAQSLLERCKIPVIPTPEHDIDVGQILLDQGHLCPFPLGVQPVQWNMAHALSLYPVPDMLCVGDKATACMYPHAGCLYANPGEFFRSGLVYIQYYPSSNRTDLKKLNR